MNRQQAEAFAGEWRKELEQLGDGYWQISVDPRKRGTTEYYVVRAVNGAGDRLSAVEPEEIWINSGPTDVLVDAPSASARAAYDALLKELERQRQDSESERARIWSLLKGKST